MSKIKKPKAFSRKDIKAVEELKVSLKKTLFPEKEVDMLGDFLLKILSINDEYTAGVDPFLRFLGINTLVQSELNVIILQSIKEDCHIKFIKYIKEASNHLERAQYVFEKILSHRAGYLLKCSQDKEKERDDE